MYLSGIAIRKLGNNSFTRLKNLEDLDISDTSIDFIPEKAFEFNDDVSEKHLNLGLFVNKLLNNSGFSAHSLTRLKRSTTIH